MDGKRTGQQVVTFHFTKDRQAELKRLARMMGRSQSEFIREAVEARMAKVVGSMPQDVRDHFFALAQNESKND